MSELNMTQVKEHFGLPLTAEFIVGTLGVKNTRQEKRAMFWNAEQIPEIARSLVNYVAERGNAKVGKTEPTDDDLGL